ncbi:CDP-alcohol phosphatidyltransferase family protein [Candidatus Saccharibacteria bacterium]|nr:CDP-alcohol phosphatidyltransferase family protein [Candidatus Saccharibacteria bacterium]
MTREIRPKDLLKLPSLITAVSLGAVCLGAEHIDTPTGKAIAAIGRAGDLVDGYIARKFDMTSDAGAIADVTADKLGMLRLGAAMWQHDITPKPVLATMALRHAISAGATLYNGISDEQKRSIRPPRVGKISMGADSLSFCAFGVADELQKGSSAHKIAYGLGWTAAIIGAGTGAVALKHYWRGEFNVVEPGAGQ